MWHVAFNKQHSAKHSAHGTVAPQTCRCFFVRCSFFVGVTVSLRTAQGPEPHDEPRNQAKETDPLHARFCKPLDNENPTSKRTCSNCQTDCVWNPKALMTFNPTASATSALRKGKTRGPKGFKMLVVIVPPYGSQKGNAELE